VTYQQILDKLVRLRDQTRQVQDGTLTGDDARRAWEECGILYGELEEVVLRIAGVREIVSKEPGSPIYRNYIEAMMLSSYRTYNSLGYFELLKVIGRVRQQANDPSLPLVAQSVTDVVRVLSRFRECCQYVSQPPKDERAVQDIMWIMLRANFDRLVREDALPKFGAKGYKPDFGIPDIGVLIEAKFVGENTKVPDIQEEILADIPGYVQSNSAYTGVVELVYDQAQKLRDATKFIEDLSTVAGILNVQVIPGIG
jgi:hypothetical protein